MRHIRCCRPPSWYLLIGTLLISGCAPAFKETYYVGVAEHGSNTMQLYRFRMTGGTPFGYEVKYESGWFSASAVEALFGESSGADTATMEVTDRTGGQISHDVYVIGPEGSTKVYRNRRLVVLMATDPSPITESIKGFAGQLSERVTAALAAERARRQAESQARQQRRQQGMRAGLLVAKTMLAADNPVAAAGIDVLLGQLDQVETVENTPVPGTPDESQDK